MLAEIKSIAHQLAPRLIEIRRHLHTHPELSGQEYQTATYVAGALNSLGLKVTEEVGKTPEKPLYYRDFRPILRRLRDSKS